MIILFKPIKPSSFHVEVRVMKYALSISKNMDNLSISEKAILDYMINNKLELINLNIEKIAEATFTSPASVVRMCKKLGYKGYKDFKIDFILSNTRSEHIQYSPYSKELINQHNDVGSKIFHNHMMILKKTLNLYSQKDIFAAAKMIMKAKRVLIYGKGSSYLVSKDLEHKLKLLGKTCLVNMELNNQMINLALSDEKDVVILISNTGKTREVISSALIAKEKKASIIGITSDAKSLLGELSDIVLLTCSMQDEYSDAESTSRISQMSIVDALYAECIAESYEISTEMQKQIMYMYKKYVK